MAKKEMDLVARAMAIPGKKPRLNHIDDEHIYLALAWAREDVSLTQASEVLGCATTGNAYVKLAQYLREGIRRGMLVDITERKR